MKITVANLISLDYFKGLKLIAGKNGLERKILDCGILDYEFDKSLRGKYLYSNFHEDQFVLTSFLYAKNNSFLILEAVKYLVGKGACGLAIKNVFNLDIHDSVIRYADSKDFPIFLIEEDSMYFEQIIINVNNYITMLSDADFCEHETNALIYNTYSATGRKSGALRLNPSFETQYFMIYMKQKSLMTTEEYYQCFYRYYKSDLDCLTNKFYKYKNGLMLIVSKEMIDSYVSDDFINYVINTLVPIDGSFCIGVSNAHHNLEEFNLALQECIYASDLHNSESCLYNCYHSMGLYKVILPILEDENILRFSRSILEPLMDYDAENKGQLLNTVLSLVECNGNLHLLSEKLGQHENTLRYRLEKVVAITGLGFRNPDHYEQLSVASKIYIAQQKISIL